MEKVDTFMQYLLGLVKTYGPQVVLALVTLVIGFSLVNMFSKVVKKAMEKKEFDKSLSTFLVSLIRISLKVMVLISVAGMVGIQTTSFIAILGAAGLAVGLALKGSLENFAGSVLILVFKPFRVGHVIEVDGRMGEVKDIQIFSTVIRTVDNKTVIIPNGGLASGTIINLSTEPIRRIDLKFGIGYDDDLKKAKDILKEIITSDTRVLTEPAPNVAVSELGDSSVNFVFRPWVKTEDYWAVYFDMVEKVKLTFDKEGISIPFPQQDIHIKEAKPLSLFKSETLKEKTM